MLPETGRPPSFWPGSTPLDCTSNLDVLSKTHPSQVELQQQSERTDEQTYNLNIKLMIMFFAHTRIVLQSKVNVHQSLSRVKNIMDLFTQV